MRIAVLVPTTKKPVLITGFSELPEGSISMVIAEGDYRPLDMSGDFDMLVSAQGPYARNMSGYRARSFEMRLSDPLESGKSWEVPALVALHLTVNGFQISADIDACDAIIFATGAVTMDLDIARERYFLGQKLAVCAAPLNQANEGGLDLLVHLPSVALEEDDLDQEIANLPPSASVGRDQNLQQVFAALDGKLIATTEPVASDAGAGLSSKVRTPLPWFSGGVLLAAIAGLGGAQTFEIFPRFPSINVVVPDQIYRTASKSEKSGENKKELVLKGHPLPVITGDVSSRLTPTVAAEPSQVSLGVVTEHPEIGPEGPRTESGSAGAPVIPAADEKSADAPLVLPDPVKAGLSLMDAVDETGQLPELVIPSDTGGGDDVLPALNTPSNHGKSLAPFDPIKIVNDRMVIAAAPELTHTDPLPKDSKTEQGRNGTSTDAKLETSALRPELEELRPQPGASCKGLMFGGARPVKTKIKPDAKNRYLSAGGPICGLAIHSNREGVRFRVVYDVRLQRRAIGNSERFRSMTTGSHFIFFQRDIPVSFDYTILVTELNSEGVTKPRTYRHLTTP